jgi:hypothetical protein
MVEMTKQDILRQTSFGHRIAEEETRELTSYFVQTDQWQRIFAGNVDIVYGRKGSGKSAIYSVLLDNATNLFDRRILITSAENPRGAPAFKDLVADPPTSEQEFRALWKLYFLSLAGALFKEYAISNEAGRFLTETLEEAGLLPKDQNLSSVIRSALDYARALLRIESVEAGIRLDPVSGLPAGLTGKITLKEPSSAGQASGLISVDSLFRVANDALAEQGFQLWIASDRLDIAFAENTDLEENALRALFKAYLDLVGLDRIHPKIFLRSDIWERITKAGFREASHITRHVTITWDKQSLMNLVIRRVLKNEVLREQYQVEPHEVLSDYSKQTALFYRMFPDKVDAGDKKPETIDWMLSRTRDGLGETAPRELIHLLSSVREVQLRKLEIGETEPPGEILIDRPAIKEGLIQVSKVRLEQTIFAEYPYVRESLLKLRGEKTQQTSETLAAIWAVDTADALRIANSLVEIGFFEERGSRENPEFWVPFLYRDALDMVQGAA